MFYLYKFLILSITIKYKKSIKLSIKQKTKKAFNMKLNKLIKTINIINKYQIKVF